MPPTIIIHELAHAEAALTAAGECGIVIRIESAGGAARQGGAAWFAAVVAAARATHPGAVALAVLDCGAEAGTALGAVRAGLEAIRLRGPAPARSKLAAIAAAAGVIVVEGRRGPCLDLLDSADPLADTRRFLADIPRRSRGARESQSAGLQKENGSAMSGRDDGAGQCSGASTPARNRSEEIG